MSPNPEAYGKGELNGVAASQAGNSAVGGANLIPLLSLGIPGDLGAAVLLGAFMLQGLHPGPLLFSQHMDTILSLFMSLFAASLITLIQSLWFIRIAGQVSKIPKSLIFSAVMVFCIVGAYGINQNMFDVYATFGFGIFGYIMKKFDFSAAALLIAFILEPMLESAFRGSMILSHGSYLIFFRHPIALGLLIATTVCLMLIFRHKKVQASKEKF
jgi:putative tricarboxylic transport membrane protein